MLIATPPETAATTTEPSKAEEIATLGEIIESLPDGYLRDILTDARPMIESQIKSDLVYVPLRQMFQSQVEQGKKLTELEKESKKLEAANAKARGLADRCRTSLAMIREDSEFIVRQLQGYRD